MSALMNPSQPSRPQVGRAAPPSATGPASSPQTNIPVPDYPVTGFSQNPHYFEKPEFRTPRTQGTSSQQNSPQERRGGRPSSGVNVQIPDTRGQPSSSRTQGVDRTPTQNQPSQLNPTPRTQPNQPAAAMAGTSASGAGGTGGVGPSGVNQSQRVGPSGSGGGGLFGPGMSATGGGATGTGAGGVGGSGAAGGGRGSPPDNQNRQRRPSESTRGPKLLTGAGNQQSSISAATTGASPFPHAFERWEMLSAQWEGLTRYWNRRLEQHQEEISRDPLAVQMSRNITDLSAAGANLFHAVVELQRLRASSERKFQRWFFETKADQERSREMTSELENTLRNERQKRADAMARIAKLEKEKGTAEKLVEEVRRELQISREEARRAWEELGRREQEERERTNSLRGGHPTLVGGVQVLPMPMPGVPNRGQGGSGASSSRPRTSASGAPQGPGGPTPVTAATVQPVTQPTGPTGDVVHPASPQYSQDALSEENAYVGQGDAGYRAPSLHHEPHLPEVPSPPPMGQQPTHTPVSPYHPPAGYQQPSQSQSQSSRGPIDPAGFYQQQPQQTYLHGVPERTFSPGQDSVVSEPGRPSSQASVTISDPGSDDEDDPWAKDEDGRVLRDENGLAMTQSQLELRRQQAAYQHPQSQPYQYYPAADQQQQQAGYGPGWEGITRHHHPTRLSEIIEEEERTNASLSGDDDRGVLQRR
ncbi:hypothetical protein ABW19_dt0210466 [Dactylella cylindrospora]|nr:hypothetical protein ABW19_dt0210466 [Dactylella cylindrospora]